MVYSFQLWRHPNILYRDAVVRLARCELYSMLKSISVEAELQTEELGSATFLSFQCRMLTEPELSFLSGHSVPPSSSNCTALRKYSQNLSMLSWLYAFFA